MFNEIKNIIESDNFKIGLSEINKDFFNLKQEIHIRDLIVKIFNNNNTNTRKRAFAEYKAQRKRIDLAIKEENKAEPCYLCELKFQFTGDFRNEDDWKKILDNDFVNPKGQHHVDLFILIVLEWNDLNKRIEVEKKWHLPPMHNYASNTLEWEKDIISLPEKNKLGNFFHRNSISLSEDNATYHFYFLKRENDDKP